MRARAIAAAFAIDLLAGDPQWFPHPVRAMGAAIAFGEPIARRACGSGRERERCAGALLSAAIIGAAAFASLALPAYAERCAGRRGRTAVEVVLAATTIATRDLLAEADAVLDALDARDLAFARARLARIVGRDTAHLDASEIARATIETLAESACDGIVAPLCALALGGLPLAFAFKAASTLDSTIGHIEPPYTDFGRFAAKLDDALCFVPARLTALAICALATCAGGSPADAWATLIADGGRHASPNAGRPEAAMAGALRVRLGGSNRYGGVERYGAFSGERFEAPACADARRARNLVFAVALVAGACTSLLVALRDA